VSRTERLTPRQKILSGSLITIMAGSILGGCNRVTNSYPENNVTLKSPTMEVIPTSTPMSTTPEASGITIVDPNQKVESSSESLGYPSSDDNFMLDVEKVNESQALDMVIASGQSQKIVDLKSFYKKELARMGEDPENFKFEAVVLKEGDDLKWDYLVKNKDKQYLGIVMTKDGKQEIIPEFGLIKYYQEMNREEDNFDFFLIENPAEFKGAEQKVVWDASGWYVLGLYSPNGQYMGWFDAKNQEWKITNPDVYVEPAEIIPTYELSAEPGTMVLRPEYSLDGRVEIIQENQEEFYDNFLESLMRINREYFANLKTQSGENVTDLETLKTYLLENDWIVPEGVIVPTRGVNEYYIGKSKPISKPVSLRNIEINLVDHKLREGALSSEWVKLSNYNRVRVKNDINYNLTIGSVIMIGFEIREFEEADALSLVVFQDKDYSGLGFPKGDSPLGKENLEQLNLYLKTLLYAMRGMQVEPPCELEIITARKRGVPIGDGIVAGYDGATGIGRSIDSNYLFDSLGLYNPADAAPEILRGIN